ncbi:hypothetical protein TNCV_1513711 [Trichonephila clavipes]|nr:hypothetical protein TNCV_1513711 [Trichonephila clavipes]
MVSVQSPQNSLRQRVRLHLPLSAALSTMQVTVRFGFIPPQFSGRTPRGDEEPPISLFLPPTARKDFWLNE